MKFDEIKNIVFRQAKGRSTIPIQFRSNLDWKRNERQIGLLTSIAPRKARVLDLGCGWGHTTAMLAVSRPDLEITGLDLRGWPTWKEFEKYGCRFQVGDALSIQIGNKMDLVVSFGCIEHIEDDGKCLEEIHKILVPGGLNIVFNLPNRYSFSEFSARALGIWCHEKTYTKQQVIQLFTDNGFEVLGVKREGIIPAQVGRIHGALEDLFNRCCPLLNKFDALSVTGLNFFSQAFTIISKKATLEAER